jgi:glutamate/tyrosine decarboxylase-like PLP-dependent enzyme
MDFDPNLILDLTSSLVNVKFENIRNDPLHEDMIDINQLEEFIQRDIDDTQKRPLMVIANAGKTLQSMFVCCSIDRILFSCLGTSLLGRFDDLSRIKHMCRTHDLWLHAIGMSNTVCCSAFNERSCLSTGDLLGSLAILPDTGSDLLPHCDSLTLDITKLFGIQNLPYLALLFRTHSDATSNNDEQTSIESHPFYELALHSPSIGFLSVWSISQRCTSDEILHHMQHSFELAQSLQRCIANVSSLRLINGNDSQEKSNYDQIFSGNVTCDVLPSTIVVFRFEFDDLSHVSSAKRHHRPCADRCCQLSRSIISMRFVPIWIS